MKKQKKKKYLTCVNYTPIRLDKKYYSLVRILSVEKIFYAVIMSILVSIKKLTYV